MTARQKREANLGIVLVSNDANPMQNGTSLQFFEYGDLYFVLRHIVIMI